MSEPRKRRSSGKVTISDVAKRAGVGTMTVSRALRTPDLVSDKLREKIEQVVEELGYIPNKAAGALASGESHSIAVILPSLVEKSCTLFLPSFQQHLNKAGYQLLLGYCNYSIEQEEKLLTQFLESRPAAVVVFGIDHTTKTHQLFAASKVPVLEIAEFSLASKYLNIGVDHFHIGKAATQQLIDSGYENIGFIGARGNHSLLQRQLHGWQSAMIANYRTPDHFLTTHEAPSAELGAEGLAKLLLRESTLDALVCSHEEVALGALFECHRRVIKIPSDMAIICLDGAQLVEHAYPSITSIDIDYDAMGQKAAESVMNAVKTKMLLAEPINIGFKLNSRSST
ncbi:LacI family DNA-binding transcriptional regulator [Vibrio sp. T187]|uniref:LacI family DNA-binding transcriptional regulator n=1 Tax=Vibrio TaxID=662 RepID=UPI0010C9AC16|nr:MULTISPECIES: LacI family DNA-binding transcriptional regulator [Vibrio]MBW3695857.1 LacI family DNA-binding transcriptional regulator [Vibrio sp. T187]